MFLGNGIMMVFLRSVCSEFQHAVLMLYMCGKVYSSLHLVL